MVDEISETGRLDISGTLEKGDVTWFAVKSTFSFYNVLYYTVTFTLFGWIVAFIVERGDGLFEHFGFILVLGFLFSILQLGLAVNSYLSEWTKLSQPRCLYRIGDHSLKLITDEFESDISWKYIRRAKEGSRDFTLFPPGDQAPILIPKRFFPNDHEINLFREVLEENKLLDQGGSYNG